MIQNFVIHNIDELAIYINFFPYIIFSFAQQRHPLVGSAPPPIASPTPVRTTRPAGFTFFVEKIF